MSNNLQEKLTIGILTFKPDRRVYMAIASALAQSDFLVEIIISDNGHNENLGIISRNLDRRVTYTRNEPGISAIENFIKVYELASTRYFCWLADDDFISPALAQVLAHIVSDKPGFVAYCGLPNSHTLKRGTCPSRRLMTQLSSDSIYHRILDVFAHGAYNFPFYSVFDKEKLSIEPIKRLLGWPSEKQSIDYVMSINLAVSGRIYISSQFLYFYDQTNWCHDNARLPKHNPLNISLIYILGLLFSVQSLVESGSCFNPKIRGELELSLRMILSKYLLRSLSKDRIKQVNLDLPLIDIIEICSGVFDEESSQFNRLGYIHKSFTRNALKDVLASVPDMLDILEKPGWFFMDKIWFRFPNLLLQRKVLCDTFRAVSEKKLSISSWRTN
jgi:glycosyltransferase involved in cell wall biosynthesis